MSWSKNIVVVPPKRCPACGEVEAGGFGSPCLHLVEDAQFFCKWVVVKGWYCEESSGEYRGFVFGTAIRRGPADGETEPVDIDYPDMVVIIDQHSESSTPGERCGGREYRLLGRA
jgi:hypothetical protein